MNQKSKLHLNAKSLFRFSGYSNDSSVDTLPTTTTITGTTTGISYNRRTSEIVYSDNSRKGTGINSNENYYATKL